MNRYPKFSRHLARQLRVNGGLSQQELGSYLGVHQRCVLNYEKGHNEPSVKTLVRLATFFGVSLSSLFVYPGQDGYDD